MALQRGLTTRSLQTGSLAVRTARATYTTQCLMKFPHRGSVETLRTCVGLRGCLLLDCPCRLAARMLAPAVHLLDGGSIDFPLVFRVITGPSQISVGMALLIRTHSDDKIGQSGVVFHAVVVNRELGLSLIHI